MPNQFKPNERVARCRRERGHRKMSEMPPLAPTSDDLVANPPRPLGEAGRALWDAAWQDGRFWIAPSDAHLLLLVCESIDEREALRTSVMKDGFAYDRRALDWVEQAQVAGPGS